KHNQQECDNGYLFHDVPAFEVVPDPEEIRIYPRSSRLKLVRSELLSERLSSNPSSYQPLPNHSDAHRSALYRVDRSTRVHGRMQTPAAHPCDGRAAQTMGVYRYDRPYSRSTFRDRHQNFRSRRWDAL